MRWNATRRWCSNGSSGNTRRSKPLHAERKSTSILATRRICARIIIPAAPGAKRRDPGRVEYWSALDEPHLGGYFTRPHEIHDQGKRRRQRRGFHRVSQTADDRLQEQDFPHRGSRASPRREEDQNIRCKSYRPASAVLPSAIFTR